MQQAHPIAGMPPGRNCFEVDNRSIYFEVEGDKELVRSLSEECDYTSLSWRGDPVETGSDLTIVVVTDQLQTLTYHVHQSVVVHGPRKSKKLSRIHREICKAEKRKRSRMDSPIRSDYIDAKSYPSTKVELDHRDVDHFPILLDFMYASGPSYKAVSGETSTTVSTSLSYDSILSVPTRDTDISCSGFDTLLTTQNAVSLRHIARLLEVDSMMIAVNKFIQKDLSFSTGPAYLAKAHEYKDERLVFSAQRLCAENIQRIEKKALLRLPYNLFRDIIKSLESFKDDDKPLSYFLSDLVCRYLQKHSKIRSAEVLLELTDPLIMPHIESAAAIIYTSLIKNVDHTESKKHWTGLAKLSRRCAKSVLEEYGWSDFSVNAALDDYLGKMRGSESRDSCVDSLLFATSFAAALQQAQDDYEEVHVEQERTLGLVELLQQSMSVMERVLQKREDHAEKQQQAIINANETIAKLKAEIGELRRQKLQSVPSYRNGSPIRSSSRTGIGKASPLRDVMSPQPRANASTIRDLVSPSRVGVDVYINKQRSRDELRTRSEMRSRSILSTASTQDLY
jgi:hypothetical protein